MESSKSSVKASPSDPSDVACWLESSTRARLHATFRAVENELETLYVENARLKRKVGQLERGVAETDDKTLVAASLEEPDALDSLFNALGRKPNAAFKSSRHKLKAHTSKFVSNFKQPTINASLVTEFKGHRDGIWDVSVTASPISASSSSSPSALTLATASADKSVRLWDVNSGRCLLLYTGHSGSVNGVVFSSSCGRSTSDTLMLLSASGDSSAHVWRPEQPPNCSEESWNESSEEDLTTATLSSEPKMIRISRPLLVLTGHQNVVISCQWLDTNRTAVTASWDRVAHLYDVQVGGKLVQSLQGHDAELTHVACHHSKRLVATCSADSTFRLWDFRETIHSVSVFQGHTDSVTSAAFSPCSDHIVSGSDDQCVKVWDLRNMRAAITNINAQAGVNRLDVSNANLIAVPKDNRQLVIHDMSGQKVIRLSRTTARGNKSHNRMVSAACWYNNENCNNNNNNQVELFSAGFDRLAFNWHIKGIGREDNSSNTNAKANKASKDTN